MSLQHSPAIATDGLVFYTDMANTKKSWKGAPTTNYFYYSEDYTQAQWTRENSISITANAGVAPDGTKTANLVTFPTGTLPRFHQTRSELGGQNAVLSVWVRSATSSNQYIELWLRQSGFGTTYISTGFVATQTWQRVYVTASIPAGISVMGMIYQSSMSSATNSVYLWGACLEAGSFPSAYVKSESSYGTRTNTQSVVDMISNNTITASNLVYNSSGDFSFNGTSSVLTTQTLPYQFLTTGVTISISFKYTRTSNNDNLISWGNNAFNAGLSYSWEVRIRGDGAIEFAPGVYTTGTAPARMTYNPTTSLNGRDVVLDIVYTPSGVSYIYEDGIAVATYDYSGVGLYSNTQALRIGQGSDSLFPGKIYSVKLYNRPLSAAEVKRNFDVTAGRRLGQTFAAPATTATQIKNAPEYAGNPPNGVYWLKPGGAASAFPAFIDFTTPNGPWIHVGTALGGTTASGGDLWPYPATWVTRTSNFGVAYTDPSLAQNCFNAGAFIYCKGNRIMLKEGGGTSGGSVGYAQATGLNSESWRDVYKGINMAAWPAQPSYLRILPIDTSYRTVSSTSLIYGTNWDTLATQNQFIAYCFDAGGDTMAMLSTGIYAATHNANGEADIGIGANENGPATGGTPSAPVVSSTVSYDAGSNGTTATNWTGVAFSLWINN